MGINALRKLERKRLAGLGLFLGVFGLVGFLVTGMMADFCSGKIL